MTDAARTLLALLAVLAALSGPVRTAGAAADPAQVSPTRKVQLFNIPAQPLISALQAYSAVTGSQVLCDSRLAAGRRSRPVVGLFTNETALRMMLDGAELTLRYTGPQDITLMSTSAAIGPAGADSTRSGGGQIGAMVLDTLHVDVPPVAEPRPDFGDYGRTVRLAVKQALARDPQTANRIFDLQIDLWVSRDGKVRGPRLLRSTGRPDLDAAIRRVLEATIVKDSPPPGLPQPIRIAVVAI